MTGPHGPLVEKVAMAISQWMNGSRLPSPPNWGRLQESTRQAYREQAQAAIDACHAEEMATVLRSAHAHVQELRDAWERGAIREYDGLGGTRSNRNVDVEVALRFLLAKLDGKPTGQRV